MKKLSREDIDERLDILRQTKRNEESFFVTRPNMAMCYSMGPPREFFVLKKCSQCGAEFQVKWTNYQNSNITIFENIVLRFVDIGMNSQLICNCPQCIYDKQLADFEIKVKTAGEEFWHRSYPNIGMNKKNANSTSIYEYEIVLNFLTTSKIKNNIADFFDEYYNVIFRNSEKEFYENKPKVDFHSQPNLSFNKASLMIRQHILGTNLDKNNNKFYYNRFVSLISKHYKELSYKGLVSEEFTHHFENAGFIKSKIDLALNKVLGLEIIYDKEEVLDNIKFLLDNALKNIIFFSSENCKNDYLKLSCSLLEKQFKQQFSIEEYYEFVKALGQVLSLKL